MLKQLNNLHKIISYYLLESFVISVFAWSVWHFILLNRFGFEFKFHEMIALIFIFKLVLNNLFAILTIAAETPKE